MWHPSRRDRVAVGDFDVVTLIFGGLLMVGALASGLAHRSFLSLTALFVLAGFLLGDGGLGVLEIDPRSGFVHDLAVVALIVILFRDGLEVEAEMLQKAWRLPLRKLVVAMPLTCVIVAVATHWLTDLGWTESFLSARCSRRPTRCCRRAWSPTRACRGSSATR